MQLKLEHSYLYIAFLFGVVLPLSTPLSNVFLILFYLSVAALFVFNKKAVVRKYNFQALLFSTVLLFSFCVISFLISDDHSMTMKIIGRRITFLLTPLVFLLLNKENLHTIKQFAIKGLIFGSFLSAVILLVNILVFYYATRPLFTVDNELFDFYHTGFQFTEILNMHPSYLGMYYLLALATLFFEKPFLNRFITFSIIATLLLTLAFLASRIVLGLLLILILWYVWSFVRNRTTFLKTLMVYTLLLFSFVSICYGIFGKTYLFHRITNEAMWELSYNVNNSSSNTNIVGDSRVARWGAALEAIKENPILGYGVGNETEALIAKYKKNGLQQAVQKRYNAHNQFIGFTLEVGLVGLLLFLFFLISNTYLSLKANNKIAVFFFISLFFIALVENYFVRNAGITYVAFFASLFLFINHKYDKD